MTDTSNAQATGVAAMAAWALNQVGKGYSESPGLRCGPNSYDCSGLVYKSCVSVGIRPPGGVGIGCSTTYSQWPDRDSNGNVALPPGSSFALGDLVYFDNGDGGRQPGHVGISLGEGSMISALNHDEGIKVTPISYGGSVMGGIRLPGSMGTATTLTSVWGDLGDAAKSAVGAIPIVGPIISGGVSAVTDTTQLISGIDKISTHLSDPSFMRRIGKGALAGLVGIVAVLVFRKGVEE